VKDTESSATKSPNRLVSLSTSIGAITPQVSAARFDDEGLTRHDRSVHRLEAHGERLQIAALDAPVFAAGELRARLDRGDAGLGSGRWAGPAATRSRAPTVKEESLFGNFGPQVGASI
jgi:hypothetical protein